LIIFLLFFEENIIIIYTMAQRKTRKTKKKAKKGERAGQRQKQKQTQRIIINLGEELAKRGGGGDGALIHSPAQYTWTMYDTATNDAGGVKP
jgi:hypothetical protein